MHLVAIELTGAPSAAVEELTDTARAVLAATAQMYERAGYQPPWIGYLALENGHCVGTCSFKGPPLEGCTEIAYCTFPGHEGRGVALEMATELLRVARAAQPSIVLQAQTLPERSASTTILAKLGFTMVGEVDHPEDGRVWEWQLQR